MWNRIGSLFDLFVTGLLDLVSTILLVNGFNIKLVSQKDLPILFNQLLELLFLLRSEWIILNLDGLTRHPRPRVVNLLVVTRLTDWTHVLDITSVQNELVELVLVLHWTQDLTLLNTTQQSMLIEGFSEASVVLDHKFDLVLWNTSHTFDDIGPAGPLDQHMLRPLIALETVLAHDRTERLDLNPRGRSLDLVEQRVVILIDSFRYLRVSLLKSIWRGKASRCRHQ